MTTTNSENKHTETILVIEHDSMLREGIRSILEVERYHVIEAPDATVGCELACELHPELIICAVNLPVQNGYETLSLLRKNGRTADIPVILVSDKWVDQPMVRFGMSLGASDILIRPYKATDLLGSIHARLEYRRAVAAYGEAKIRRLRGSEL